MPDGWAQLNRLIIDDPMLEQASEKKMPDPGLITRDLKRLLGEDTASGFDEYQRSAFIFGAIASLATCHAKLKGLGEKVNWNR